jgi:FMN phosphatase YigB (HAD superfamily)
MNKKNMNKVASFDVFDTVLTRVVGSPHTLFLLVGKRLAGLSLIDCTPETFACARIDAERHALKKIGEELTLRHIYTELGTALKLTETQCNQIMELECALQTELIRPVPLAKDYVQAARDQGQRVVFISDMHLSSEFIQKQLVRHGLWMDGDRCYVSCEYGKSKTSGELFQEVLHCEGISPELIVHCGNDSTGDVRAAKRVKLQTKFFSEGNLNRYEKILESEADTTEGLSSVMAGASRLARLTVPTSSPKEEALRDVTAGVMAPLLVGYVLWILHRAQQLGLKRLYFLSRDGQILLAIAQRLVGKLNISCELRYLYGSRLSWNLPIITSTDEHWVWAPILEFPTIENALDRLGIHPEEVSDRLSAVGFTQEDWSRQLNQNEVQVLRTLVREQDISEFIFQKAAQKRTVLIEYLKQEGLLDSTEKGIVDLAGQGTLYKALSKLLNTTGVTPIVGFYFGITDSSTDNQYDLREAYFFDKRSESMELWRGIRNPLEMFCLADHGTVLSFKKEGEKIHPVLEEERNQTVIDWGLPILRKTVDCFVENLLLDLSLVNPQADVRVACSKALKAFWLNPSYDQASAWGSLPWEEHLLSKGTYRRYCAESYRWTHLFNALSSWRFPRHHQDSWLEGSIVLSPPAIRIVLKSIVRSGKMLLRIKRELFKFLTAH